MSNVIHVHFGAKGTADRIRIADWFAELSVHIRNGELEFEPEGFVLLLSSSKHPAGFDVYHSRLRNAKVLRNAAATLVDLTLHV